MIDSSICPTDPKHNDVLGASHDQGPETGIQPQSNEADQVQTGLEAMSLVEATHTDPIPSQATDPDKLSSEDFVELRRISKKKEDIERHIADLKSWPSWDPFRDVSSYSADSVSLQASQEALNTIANELRIRQDECSRLEKDVQQFNMEDMRRLRTVAKAISKRHLSGPDTDILELALETVYALDKLVRLLREQRTEHELTQLRLQWENMICSSWGDVVVLQHDINVFEEKCKSLHSSRLDNNGTTGVPADQSRTEQITELSNGAPYISSKKRAASMTPSSLKLAAESVKLEASRLSLRVKSFDIEKVRVAGKILDLLIDQRKVPEKLIDEQEKLEDALTQPSAIEAKASELAASLRQMIVPSAEAQRFEPPPIAELSTKCLRIQPERELGTVSQIEPSTSDPATTPRMSTQRAKSGTSSRQVSTSSGSTTPARHTSNRYRPNPRDALDVAVGKIVNRMPIKVSIRSALNEDLLSPLRSNTMKDLSGQYWIGDPEPRLCYCRILPSSTVMVRVGGGWQELSGFLCQHYAHLSARGVHTDSTMLAASPIRPGPNIAWLRSASNPVESPRLRKNSSVQSLRSLESARLVTPQRQSRIVTMPTMKRRGSTASTAGNTDARPIPTNTPKQVPAEHYDRDLSTPTKISDLPSSGSNSSIVIHPLSPSI